MIAKDYWWTVEMNTLPMWVRTLDDDAGWYEYRREERYNESQAGGAERRLALWGEAERWSGGVRRMLARDAWRRKEGGREGELLGRDVTLRAGQLRRADEDAAAGGDASGAAADPLATPPAKGAEAATTYTSYDDMTDDQRYALDVLGVTAAAWDAGAPIAAKRKAWTNLTSAEQFAAFFFGWNAARWDAAGPGGRFPGRPPARAAAAAAGEGEERKGWYAPDWLAARCDLVEDASQLEAHQVKVLRETLAACCAEWCVPPAPAAANGPAPCRRRRSHAFPPPPRRMGFQENDCLRRSAAAADAAKTEEDAAVSA